MDMDGTATMEAAAVALVYDLVATPFPPPGQSKHDVHELRGSAINICKIFEGKIAQNDLVVFVGFFRFSPSSRLTLRPQRSDTAEFQPEASHGPQLENCSVM
jgi:hypothetical protein